MFDLGMLTMAQQQQLRKASLAEYEALIKERNARMLQLQATLRQAQLAIQQLNAEYKPKLLAARNAGMRRFYEGMARG